MSIAFRNASTAYDATGPAITIGKPAGTADGDILIAFGYCYKSGGITPVMTPPDGWAVVDEMIPVGGRLLGCYWKRASSEGASWDFTGDEGTKYMIMACAAYSGCIATGTPYDQLSDVAYQTNDVYMVATGITPTVSPSMGLVVAVAHNAFTSASQSGWTERVDYGASGLVYLCDKALSTTDAVADLTITADGSASTNKHAWMLNLKEPVPATAKPYYYFAQQ